ncbi:hypothetical protein FOCG_17547 [Fusarium oxysporum f. sp. radicis-lycopersici 26381]|nr:hypothetical protein FOCG_17547 [Fusarium oxysporum f. sp. radicis-lycopersici 26381]
MDIDSEPFNIDLGDPMDIEGESFNIDLGDPMDIESEPILMRREDNAFSNAKPIDSQDTTALTSRKATFKQNALSKLSRDKKLKHVKARRDGVNKLSRLKPKYQFKTSTDLGAKQRILAYQQKEQLSKLPKNHNEKISKENSAYIMSLSYRLVGPESLKAFAENCEKTIPDWYSLLKKTTLPDFADSSHPCIISAFKAVDSIICGKQGTYLLRRLAYIQLMRLFTSLEAMIKSERQAGSIPRKRGHSNANIALDIYLSAQHKTTCISDLRRELKERKRTGRSWTNLAEPSPLLAMMYSTASEPILYESHPAQPVMPPC